MAHPDEQTIDAPTPARSGEHLSCLTLVCLLNEEDYLPRFLASMARQTRFPERLVLVDDGSTDRSVELCEAWAADKPWVRTVQRPRRPPSKDRLATAPEFGAFKEALELCEGDEDVVVKMDADLELAPHHFETILGAMEAEPRLGICGTYLAIHSPSGAVEIEPHPVQHVRGPTRFYRRTCWDAIAPIPTIIGWDGADEVRARDRGWATRSLPIADPPTFHLRPTGSHDGRLRAFTRWGEVTYAIGAHPLGVVAGGLIRMKQRPRVIGGIAYVIGWYIARFRKIPRFPDDIRQASRAENVRRLRSGSTDLRDA
ncbi:glycosyltransferase family 2 protein [Patulibacter minatonensis]|uniref:glycosyltransferase family 2 protein n=1 Tax=Patulibacter minatonensis TaxID=298163 RepID=UPI00047C8E71|nr:glycosyltransferase [Patulibacter minatonensis]